MEVMMPNKVARFFMAHGVYIYPEPQIITRTVYFTRKTFFYAQIAVQWKLFIDLRMFCCCVSSLYFIL